MQENLNLFEQSLKARKTVPPIVYGKIEENRMIEIGENIFISPDRKKARINYDEWTVVFKINGNGKGEEVELSAESFTNFAANTADQPHPNIVSYLKKEVSKAINQWNERQAN